MIKKKVNNNQILVISENNGMLDISLNMDKSLIILKKIDDFLSEEEDEE